MPKIPNDAINKQEEIMASTLQDLNTTLSITTQPVVVCGVQRKINIGDFETVDVYCSVALPVQIDDLDNQEELETKLLSTMEKIIEITSKETGEKYGLIRDATEHRRKN